MQRNSTNGWTPFPKTQGRLDLARPSQKRDRHDGTTKVVTVRMPIDMYNRLVVGMTNNRTPRPMDSVGAYILWLLETGFLRKR